MSIYMYTTVNVSLSKIEEQKCEIAEWQQFLKHEKTILSRFHTFFFSILF